MTCERLNLGGGRHAIVCSTPSRPTPCCVCGLESSRLCDYATGKGKTCSASLCDRHTTRDGERDLCPTHRAIEAQEARVDAEQAPVAFIAPVGRASRGLTRSSGPQEQLGLPIPIGGPRR